MRIHQVPGLVGAGCLAMCMGVAVAQSNTGGGMGSSQQTQPPGQVGNPASPNGNTGAMAPAGSQTMGGNSDMAGGGSSDKNFVKEAMQGSMAEIQLGQMAQQNASSDDVKQFAQRMVQDHTKMNEQMQPIASQLGVTPPTDLDGKHKSIQKKLQGKTGAEFDKAYMSAMVQDHKKDLSEFQKEASSGKNPQVKDAAQQGSQIISEHLQMAQDIAQKVGASGGSKGMSGNGKTAPQPGQPVGGASGSPIGGGGNTAGHDNSVGSGSGNTSSNPK